MVAKEALNVGVALLSALRFHGLTIRYSKATFNVGVELHSIEGVPVSVFTPASTLADCFKYRKKVGLDVAIEALKDALRQKKAFVVQIAGYAEVCRVSRIIRPYLEALA